jgi:hypothetical protein
MVLGKGGGIRERWREEFEGEGVGERRDKRAWARFNP